MIEKLYRLQNTAARRWYQLDTGLELFGERVLVRRWGAAGSAHGGMSTTVLANGDALEAAVAGELKRRAKRGYVVASDACKPGFGDKSVRCEFSTFGVPSDELESHTSHLHRTCLRDLRQM